MGGPASVVFHKRDARDARNGAGPKSSSSLAALVDESTPIDASGLAGWMLRWPPNRVDETLYRGIDTELVTTPPKPPREVPSVADAPAFLRRALDEAVDVALAGVRRVAVMASGGIDSSVLLGLTMKWAERTGGLAFAVNLDYEGPGDDRPHLLALQHHLKCEVLRVAPEDCVRHLALLESGADAAPAYAATMIFEVELLERARAHGAERVISGVGGDEMFSGEPRALAEVAWKGQPLQALRSARRLSGFGRPRIPAWSWVMRPLIARAIPMALRAWRASRTAPYPSPDWAGPVTRAFVQEKHRLVGGLVRRTPRTADERYANIRDDDRRRVLAWGRQLEERVTGLDGWDPYLDLDLAAAVASLPPSYLLVGDRWRGLFRESARDLLPATVRERMDKAANEPALRRLIDAAGGLETLRPLASVRELESLGLVEPKAFAAAFDHFVANPEDGVSWVQVWSALAIEAFLRGRAN